MTRSDDTWSNWAGNVTASPRDFAAPADADEVAAVVTAAAQAGRRVKPIGAGHSFTAAAATDGVQLRLDRITGLTHIDRDRNLVTVGGGTTIADLNQLLAAEGLALENLGDIDQQTISGAISTGTHGTGAALGGMATQVRELQLVLADGNKIICSIDQHPDIFAAVRVGLGALGVITEVTLQCVPAFRLRAVEGPGLLEAVLESFAVDVAEHDHFEFYWFPHTDRTLTKRNDRVPVDHQGRALPRWRYLLDDELLSNGLFEVVNRLGRLRPSLVPRINQISARALSAREFTDTSYAVFNSPRRVRFVESEYAVPRPSLRRALAGARRGPTRDLIPWNRCVASSSMLESPDRHGGSSRRRGRSDAGDSAGAPPRIAGAEMTEEGSSRVLRRRRVRARKGCRPAHCR